MTTPLISLLPGGIDADGFWTNDGGATGGSSYDLDTKDGAAGSITRTTDSKTSQNMTTLSTAANCRLLTTSSVTINDPWTFVMFATFDRDAIVAATSPTFLDTRDTGNNSLREFLFFNDSGTEIQLGRQGGPPHTTQAASFGRQVLAGRLHDTTGDPQDWYVSGGVDQRNWFPGTPQGFGIGWVSLFGNRQDQNLAPMSFGEIHVWDSLLPDQEYMEEIRKLEAKWEAQVSNKTGSNF